MALDLILNRTELRRARLEAGLSQSALAAKVGVHAITMTRYESGTINPRPDTLRRLARALGVDLAAISSVEDRPRTA